MKAVTLPTTAAMTAEQFAADLEALIAIARHEGLSDQELLTLLRASTDALVPSPSSVSRIVRSRSKKAHRPTPAIAVPTVVWRRQLRRWRDAAGAERRGLNGIVAAWSKAR